MIGIAGIFTSSGSIFSKVNQYHESAKKYKNIQIIYDNSKNRSLQTKNPNENMAKINQDYVGWIRIKDTNINYPVVKTDNNRFYLHHNFYKEKDFVGSIFMDYRNSNEELNKHTILYGHNMRDSSMFGSLKKYKDKKYLDGHKIIQFEFLNRTYEWEIVSVYNETHTDWMITSFATKQEFGQFLQMVETKSMYGSLSKVNQDDTILTLATCTNKDENERIVIHAKLITKGKGSGNEKK